MTSMIPIKTLFLLLALFPFVPLPAAAQSPDASGKRPASSDTYAFDLAACAPDCFARGFTNLNEPKNYVLPLRRGQRVVISIGWAELPAGVADPLGAIDRSQNGFTIIDPRGRKIRNSLNKFVLKDYMSGEYRVVVKPHYRRRSNSSGTGEPVNRDYRLDVTAKT